MRFFLLLTSLLFTSITNANEAMKHYEQALSYLNAGKFSAAEIAVKNSLQLDLNYLPARLLLGKVLLRTGKYQSAEKEFEQSLQLHADSFTVIISLVEVKLLLNKNEQALNLLAKYPQLQGEAQYFYFQANAYKALQQYEKALAAYEQAIVVQGYSAKMHTAIADLWQQQEKMTEAKTEISKALKLDRNFIPALLLSSEIHKNLEEYQQADDAITLVLHSDKNNKQALFAKAGLLLAQNKLSEALTIALKIRELAPSDPYAKLLHSSIIAQQGQSKQARRILSDIKQQLSGVDDRHRDDQQVLLLSATVDFINTDSHSAKQKFLRYIELYGENSSARRYLAIIAYRAQDLEKAQQHIEKALIQNSHNAELHLLAAEIYRQASLPRKQRETLQKAKEIFPENDKVMQHYVASLLESNMFTQALDILNETNTKSSLQNKTVLAFMQLKSGLYKEASATTQQLLDNHGDKVEVLQLAGELSLKTSNDSQNAVYFFEQALVLDANFTPALLSLAGIYLQQGNVGQVEKLYQQLLSINEHDALTLQLYADLAIKQGRLALGIKLLDPLTKNNNYKTGRALLNLYIATQQSEQALTLLTRLEKDYPIDEALLLSKSRVLAQLDRKAQAEKSLKILYGLIYDDSDKLITLAHAQLDLTDLESAEKSINRIKSLENASVPPYLQARYYVMQKSYDKAGQLIEQAILKSPESSGWLALNMQLLIAQNKLPQATKIQEKLYQKHNTREDLQLLARLYGQQEQIVELMNLLTAWLKKTPSDDWARSQLSALALSQGNEVLAIEVLEQSPNLASQPIFMNNLASYHLDNYISTALSTGTLLSYSTSNSATKSTEPSLEKAIDYARKAYKLAPNIAAINDTLGWAYVLKGQVNKGLSLLREASARDANNGDIYYHLAFALAKLNNMSQANTALNRAIGLSPDHALREVIRNQIK